MVGGNGGSIVVVCPREPAALRAAADELATTKEAKEGGVEENYFPSRPLWSVFDQCVRTHTGPANVCSLGIVPSSSFVVVVLFALSPAVGRNVSGRVLVVGFFPTCFCSFWKAKTSQRVFSLCVCVRLCERTDEAYRSRCPSASILDHMTPGPHSCTNSAASCLITNFSQKLTIIVVVRVSSFKQWLIFDSQKFRKRRIRCLELSELHQPGGQP